MAKPETPNPTPENPQFTVANQLMAHHIQTLKLVKTAQEQMEAEAQKREDELREKANRDPLTEIPNRFGLQDSYAGLQNSERQRAYDAGEPLTAGQHSVLMVDIDNFKQVNDRHGHKGGDRILRKVAGLIQDNTRRRDVAARIDDVEELTARIGGDELAVLLPRANSEQATQVAEKIRRIAEADSDITLSIGVAGIDLDRSLEDNLVNADTALYDAKQKGRNQVVRYEDLVARQQNGVFGDR